MIRRQRIAHIMPWEGVGGTEHAALRIARAVQEDGFDTVFFCLGSAPTVRNFFSSAGFETATWSAAFPQFEGYRYFLHGSMRLAGEFRRRNIDLVHCADLWAGTYAAVAGRAALAPVICHVRSRYTHIARPQRRMLGAVSQFVFVSRSCWRQFGYAVPERRGAVIYDGVEPDACFDVEAVRREVRREFDVPDDTLLVGMIARVDEAKDYKTLAKAARRMLSAGVNVRFLIVGGYSVEESQLKHFDRVKRWLAESNVDDRFTFTDFRSDVQRLIQGMDIVALSTHYEGLPLSLLEAMACGKPVVATDVDGIPELVTHDETGLLFPPGDDESLASHLIALEADRPRATQLAARGRRFVETNVNREQFKRKVVGLYDRVLHRKRVSAVVRPAMDSLAEFARKTSLAALDASITERIRR